MASPGCTVYLLASAAALLGARDAAGQQLVLDFETDTFCDPAGLATNGSARVAVADCLLVVTDGTNGSVGTAWSTELLSLGPASVLRTRFALDILPGFWDPGSGMTFALLSGPPDAVGYGGYGLGYGTLTPSVAVELDTFHTPEALDLDGNHVGVDVGGSMQSVDAADPGLALTGQLWVWVEYHQRDQRLEVRIADTAHEPREPLLSTTIDVLGEVGSSPRAGFTAANTGYTDAHLVRSWLLEVDDDTDADGVMDFEDRCDGDDAEGDSDLDRVCDDLDACPGADDALDADADGVPDCLEAEPVPPPDTDTEKLGPAADRAPGPLRGASGPPGCGCGGGHHAGGLFGVAGVLLALRRRTPAQRRPPSGRDTPARCHAPLSS